MAKRLLGWIFMAALLNLLLDGMTQKPARLPDSTVTLMFYGVKESTFDPECLVQMIKYRFRLLQMEFIGSCGIIVILSWLVKPAEVSICLMPVAGEGLLLPIVIKVFKLHRGRILFRLLRLINRLLVFVSRSLEHTRSIFAWVMAVAPWLLRALLPVKQ